jgi:hypothetical protein
MSFIELTTAPAEGKPSQKITAVAEQIAFAFKQPLSPYFTIAIGPAILPCIGNYEAILKQLEEGGLTIFDTMEGGRAAINHKHVLFFTSPELGIYMFMFNSKIGLTFQTTLQEVTQMFDKRSSIILE